MFAKGPNRTLTIGLAVALVIALVASVILIYLPSTGQSGGSGNGDAIARVNGAEITRDRLMERVAETPAAQQTFDLMVTEQLISQEAEKEGVTVEASEVQEELNQVKSDLGSEQNFQRWLQQYGRMTEAQFRDSIRMNLMITKILDDDIEVTEDKLRSYYEENKDRYGSPATVSASVIVTETREEAESLRAQVNQGADFAELAKEHSIAPSAEQGGDVGSFTQQQRPDLAAAFELEVGQVSEVVQAQNGFQIIQVTERTEAEQPTFEAVRQQVEEDFIAAKVQEKAGPWLQNLRAQADIQIYDDRFQRQSPTPAPPSNQ